MTDLTNRTSAPRRPQFARLDAHAHLCRQLAEITQGEVVGSRRTDWHSVTFAGARHQIVLRTASPAARLHDLAEHDFILPGAFVADLAVVEIDEDRVTVEALVVDE